MNTTPEKESGLEIAITEYFEAPRELVFRNWIEAELVRTWFAPPGFTVSRCEIEGTPGSRWTVTYESPDGDMHTEFGEFIEVVPPSTLVFTLTQQNSRGQSGAQTLVRVAFEQVGSRTRMDFRQSGYRSKPTRDGNAEGWRECLRQLRHHLAAH
jgi:uncharacterized protein YndB with AHSA1/START domain